VVPSQRLTITSTRTEPSRALITRTTYVASTTLTEPACADTTVLSGDLTAAVGQLTEDGR
jgi:hypothetical protein